MSKMVLLTTRLVGIGLFLLSAISVESVIGDPVAPLEGETATEFCYRSLKHVDDISADQLGVLDKLFATNRQKALDAINAFDRNNISAGLTNIQNLYNEPWDALLDTTNNVISDINPDGPNIIKLAEAELSAQARNNPICQQNLKEIDIHLNASNAQYAMVAAEKQLEGKRDVQAMAEAIYEDSINNSISDSDFKSKVLDLINFTNHLNDLTFGTFWTESNALDADANTMVKGRLKSTLAYGQLVQN